MYNNKGAALGAQIDHKRFEKNLIQQYVSTPNEKEEEYMSIKYEQNIKLKSIYAYPRTIFPYSTIFRDQLSYKDKEYHVNNDAHFLKFVYLILELPKISILPECKDLVEICWTHNLFHSIVDKGISIEFSNKGVPLFTQLINREKLDDNRIMNINNIEAYDYDIGNRDELIEWNNELKTDEDILLELPFFFSDADNTAIPVKKISGNPKEKDPGIKIIFKENFNLHIPELLRMRIRKDTASEWTYLMKPELHFLNIKTQKLSGPELWGEYILQSEEEFRAAINDRYTVVITDYIYPYEEDIFVNNNEVSIKLNYEDAAIKSINYALLNYKSYLLNNKSNYTTDHNNAYEGKDPIKKSYIKYNNVHRVPPLGSIHTSRLNRSKYFKGVCDEKGWHSIPFSYYPANTGPDISCVPDETAELYIQLKPRSSTKNMDYDILDMEEDTYRDREWELKNTADKIGIMLEYIKEKYPKILLDDSITDKYVLKYCIYIVRSITYMNTSITVDKPTII